MSNVALIIQLLIFGQTIMHLTFTSKHFTRRYYCAERMVMYVRPVMKANNVCNIQVNVSVSLFSTLRISISSLMTDEINNILHAIYNRYLCILLYVF